MYLNGVYVFFRFEIARNMLDQLTITLTSAITAEGRIKYYSIYRGCSYFLPLPISILLFNFGFSPYWFYIVWIVTWNGIGSAIILYYAHKNCGMQYVDFYKVIVVPVVLITIITLSISGLVTVYIKESFFTTNYCFVHNYDNIYFSMLGIGIFFKRKRNYFFGNIGIDKRNKDEVEVLVSYIT